MLQAIAFAMTSNAHRHCEPLAAKQSGYFYVVCVSIKILCYLCSQIKILKTKIMATVILEYDSRNRTAEKLMSVILAMDNLFKGIEVALEDVKKGRVYTAANVKSLINSCLS